MYYLAGGAFLGGVWVAPLILSRFSPILIAAGAVLAAAAFLARRIPERTLLAVLGSVLLGLSLASLRLPAAERLPLGPTTLEGTVAVVAPAGSGERLTVREVSVFHDADRAVSVGVGAYPEYQRGDRIRVTATLKRPDPFPHGWLAAGIEARASSPRVELLSRTDQGPLAKLHRWGNEQISELLAEPEAGLLSGLIFGDRSELPAGFRDSLNRTGTSHIVAVSGYNVSLVVLFVWLLRGLIPYRLLLAVSGAAVLGFVALVGPSSSVVRAALMGSLVLLALGLGRPAAAGRLLVLAAVGMALWNPWVLHDDLGFLLSFAATAGIIWLEPRITPRLARRLPHRAAQALGVVIAAQIATDPLVLGSFGRLSLASIPVNLVVVPLVPLAMLIGALMLIAAAIWAPAAEVASWLTWPVLHAMVVVIETGCRLPRAAIEGIVWPLWATPALYAALAALVGLGERRRRIRAL